MGDIFCELPKALSLFAAHENAIHFEHFSKEVLNEQNSLDSADKSAGTKLSAAVIAIRAEIRARLAGMLKNPNDISNKQRDRIVDMTGDIVKRRSELEKLQNSQSPKEGDTDAIKISKISNDLITNTAVVASVFRECVDPATQREIQK